MKYYSSFFNKFLLEYYAKIGFTQAALETIAYCINTSKLSDDDNVNTKIMNLKFSLDELSNTNFPI